MRPDTLDEFLGQDDIVGEGTLLRAALEQGALTQSIILWGPPGCGKTTLARIISKMVRGRFVKLSAVTSGIAEVKRIVADARKLRTHDGHPVVLFVDEIHRFNKAQQDAFLPHIEDGTIVFVGATTENPSFEVIGPLLSRSRVVVLHALTSEHVLELVRRALSDTERGLGESGIEAEEDALVHAADVAQGDARVALNAFGYAASVVLAAGQTRITRKHIEDAVQKRTLLTDKTGESHYNVISALIKSLRGSDVDAALYWLARLVEAGEDPKFIARRLVIFASEDIGNADPNAIVVAVAVKEAVVFVGYPECRLNLSQAITYLALAPKSNASYLAYDRAAKAVHEKAPYPVPLHLRNAPTPMMKNLGYGAGYQYPHDYPEAYTDQQYLPDELEGSKFYEPKDVGAEAEARHRLDSFRERRKKDRDRK